MSGWVIRLIYSRIYCCIPILSFGCQVGCVFERLHGNIPEYIVVSLYFYLVIRLDVFLGDWINLFLVENVAVHQ